MERGEEKDERKYETVKKRIGELKRKEGAKAERSMIDGKEMERELGNKMKETEWKLERRKREEKRRNIIIKGIEKGDRGSAKEHRSEGGHKRDRKNRRR